VTVSEAGAGTISPEAALRRSFHYRDLVAAVARFRRLGDGIVAADYGADDVARARRLGLADLSPLPRTGFKGPSMAEWMAEHGVPLGPDSNRAYPVGQGALAARLAPGEVLFLGSLYGQDETPAALDASWSYSATGVWPVPRRDASFWFMVSGACAAPMFAKICGVDLRPKAFANHQIAQTSVARLNAIVIRDDLGDVPAFHLLGDSASASYGWMCLLDAMAEFTGAPVGLDALLTLRSGSG
jgi:sarcosine oxidase subunit gamma